MIITFDGAPATGKSTVADMLANSHACYTVPEVNALFGKENRISDLWYYQKQSERWDLVVQSQESTILSILDGDIFQPIWFSSLFPDENWGDFDEIVHFYSEMLKQDKVGFPDMYVYFHTEEWIRADRERARSACFGRSLESIEQKIARYRDFSTLQKMYFSELKKEFPDLVVFLNSNDLDNSIKSILSASKKQPYDGREILNFIIDWCRSRKATCESC